MGQTNINISKRYNSHRIGLVWNTNMAAVRFWDTNMTDVTLCENALYNMALFVFDFSWDDCTTAEKLETMVMQFYLFFNLIFFFFFWGGGEINNCVSRVYSSYPGAKEMSIGMTSDIQCSTGNQGAKYLKLHRKHGIITGKFIAVEASL